MIRRTLLACAALLSLAGPATAAAYRAPVPVERTLANGLRVAVFPDARAGLVQVQLVVPAGLVHEPRDRAGVASLTAQMLRHGTTSRASGQWTAEVERLGGTIATSVARDHATASAAFLARDLDAGLELLADAVTRPIFPDDEIERVRRQLASALAQQRATPAGLADEHVWAVAMAGHPYARSPLGAIQSLMALGAEPVRAFHRDHWRPAGSVLAIAGTVDPERAFAVAEAAFGAWSGRPVAAAPPAPPTLAPAVRIVDLPALTRAEIRLAVRTPGRSATAAGPLSLAAAVLGGSGATPRLARLGDPSARAVAVAPRDAGLLLLSANAPVDSVRVAASRLRDAVAGLTSTPPDAGELASARRALIGAYPQSFETPGGVIAQWLAAELNKVPYEDPAAYAARLESITAAEVATAVSADRVSAPVIVAIGPAAVLRPALAGFGAVEVVAADQGLEAPVAATPEEAPPTEEERRRGRELLQRAVMAHGGEAKLRGIQSSVVSGTVALSDGGLELEGQMEQVRKAPYRMSMVTRFMTMESQQVLDGDRGWTRIASDTVTVVPADSLEVAAMRAAFESTAPWILIDALDPATRLAHRGRQGFGGRDHQVVEAVSAGGTRRRLLFDVDRGFLSVIEQREPSGGIARRVYRDYRPVAGVSWPFLEERWIGDRRLMRISVQRVEVNAKVADQAFAEPKATAPATLR